MRGNSQIIAPMKDQSWKLWN